MFGKQDFFFFILGHLKNHSSLCGLRNAVHVFYKHEFGQLQIDKMTNFTSTMYFPIKISHKNLNKHDNLKLFILNKSYSRIPTKVTF